MVNGTTICSKHDGIESLAGACEERLQEMLTLVADAREDGIRMEKAIDDRNSRIKELESENEDLQERIEYLENRAGDLEEELKSYTYE